MALEADGRRGWTIGLGHRQPLNYPYELRYGRDEGKRLGKPAAITGTITTPWRVVLLGRDLNALVNSDVLPSLCPPADAALFPDGMNTKWVAAGKSVWDYVDRNYGRAERDGDRRDDNRSSEERRRAQIEHMKDFSRLGGQIGATYHILEGFAYGWSDDEIRDFVDYSNKQGVRVLFWRHSNRLHTPEEQEEFFKRLHDLGVAGAKIDFIDQETKEGVDQYESLLRTAAKYECVIDFHGANKPTGRLRTWPNDMLREAVKGMEASRSKSGPATKRSCRLRATWPARAITRRWSSTTAAAIRPGPIKSPASPRSTARSSRSPHTRKACSTTRQRT